MDELERAATDHHDWRDCAFGEIFADRLVMAFAPREMGRKAPSVGRRPERAGVSAGKIDERRQNVDERHAGADAARREAARARDDKRHAARAFEETHLVPEAA